MYPIQVLLLGAEALVLALLVLGVFRARAAIGMAPLAALVGGFQLLTLALSLRVEVAPGWTAAPAALAVLPATLLAALLVYVQEDTREARRLVQAIALANAGLALVWLVIGQHARIPGAQMPTGVGANLFSADVASVLIRTLLLYPSLIALILLYELASRFVASLFVRAAIAFAAVLAVDATAAVALASWGGGAVGRLAQSSAAGVGVATIVFAAVFAAYLTRLEPSTAPTGTGDVSEVFHELTYRQLYEQARSRLTRDALTGVYNRGYLDESFTKAVARATRYQEHLSVLVVDTDNFKSINDTYGHLAGDGVLKLVATTLVEGARAADIVCRYGGDEFVVLLPNADRSSAQSFADRVRRRLRDRGRNHGAHMHLANLSVTVGVASLLEDAAVRAPDDLLRLADNRLYVGKRAGRDRVIWQDLPVSSAQ